MNDGGHKLLRRTVDHPEEAAILWAVTGHAFTAGEDHLDSATDLFNERYAVTTSLVWPLDPPELPAICPGKRNDVTRAVVVAVDDDFVLKENRTAAKAVFAGKDTWAHLPDLLAGEVMGTDNDGLTI